MIRPEKIFETIEKNIKTKPYVKRKTKPFEILISTILSQRTRDENTKKATNQLFGQYRSPKKLSKANLKSIKKLIKPAGFYNVKARRIKNVSKIIVKKHNGKVPVQQKELLKLPGVGRKTANIVLYFAFDKEVKEVETQVHRVSNRIGIVNTENPKETEKMLVEKIKKSWWKKINHLLVPFGQKICRPRHPKCRNCPVNKWCDYYEKFYKKNKN